MYNDFNTSANTTLDFLVKNNQIVSLVFSVFLMSYGTLALPLLPKQFTSMFDNTIFKLIFITLISWTTYNDPVLGLALAVLFLFMMDLLNKRLSNTMEGYEEGNQSFIYPGCTNITVADLLESFGGNMDSLSNAMLYSKTPLDIELVDSNAPIIATYLLNKGYQLKSPCAWPSSQMSIAQS
jgi:hypothetical protein